MIAFRCRLIYKWEHPEGLRVWRGIVTAPNAVAAVNEAARRFSEQTGHGREMIMDAEAYYYQEPERP